MMKNRLVWIQEDDPPLPNNSDFEQSNAFLVSRREGELEWESVLFVRRDLVEFEAKVMREFWSVPSKTKLYAQGPPGCGKTCFFHLWARLRSVNDNKSVLSIQFREEEDSHIWVREAGGQLWRLKEGIERRQLETHVDDIIRERLDAEKIFDLCIHDGVIDSNDICSNMVSKLNTAVTNGIFKKVVHVTSLAVTLSTGGQRLDASGSIVRLSLNSWSLADYLEAIQCQEFTIRITQLGSQLSNDRRALALDDDDGTEGSSPDESSDANGVLAGGDGDDAYYANGVAEGDGDTADTVSWTDVIETKFFYAGGSARFMFDFQIAELKEELDRRCLEVSRDEWKYFAQGAASPRTPNAVNTLMQQFEKRASPVSKYILFCAYDNCKSELVNSVKAAAEHSNNPTLKGWAFELKQIDLIRLSLESSQANPEHITNNQGFLFLPQSSIECNEKTLTDGMNLLGEGTVIWCMKWNQDCFDVAFYQGRTLITIQFTVSNELSLKPNFIRSLRAELIENGIMVDRYLHVGVGRLRHFKFKLDTSGTGQPGNATEPEFIVEVYYSPPLKKRSGPVKFQSKFSSALERVNMWALGSTTKRTMTV